MSLQMLMDKHAIEQVYIRYCEIVDAKRFDDMHEVFVANATGDYTQALGPGVVSPDRASLIAAMHANLGPDSNCGPTHHNVGNFRIEVDGDTARAKVNYYAVHLGQGAYPGELYSMWGQYDDALVRTADGWRIEARIYTCAIARGPVVTSPRAA
jgi:3-phenylpropionate/cinnamic acid dioxygenase small subunit